MEAVNDRHVSQSHKIHDTTGTFACCGIPVKACGDDNDEDELSLELPDLSSVGFSWPGGKAGVRCQVFLASPTTRCVWHQVQGHFLYLEQK